MTEFASLVLFSRQVEQTVAFYRAAGIDLEGESHGDDDTHYAADVAGVHFAVLDGAVGGQAPGWRDQGSSFAGFWVDSLAATTAALAALGSAVLVDHQEREWGCRAVVQDPDGRAVEINQRNHCPPGTGR